MFVGDEWRKGASTVSLGDSFCIKGGVHENGMDEKCVKERGDERYCWRAGVMSRNEGEEEEILFV